MEWVGCYESAIEGDARLVLALLGGRGIPCRLEPMGASVLPSMGFAVRVPADRLAEARELIEHEGSGDLPDVAPEADVAPAAPEVDGSRPRMNDVVRRTLQFVRARPSVLLPAIAGIVSAIAVERVYEDDMSVRTLLREHAPVWLLLWVIEMVARGLTIAFVDGALDERPSWREAAGRMMTQLARLFVCDVVVGGPLLVAVVLGWSLGMPASARNPALLVAILGSAYLTFRLLLASVALLVDRNGLWDALGRSWSAVGRAWPTILGLVVLGAVVGIPFGIVPMMNLVVGPVLSVLATIAFVIAYRTLSGRPPATSGTP